MQIVSDSDQSNKGLKTFDGIQTSLCYAPKTLLQGKDR